MYDLFPNFNHFNNSILSLYNSVLRRMPIFVFETFSSTFYTFACTSKCKLFRINWIRMERLVAAVRAIYKFTINNDSTSNEYRNVSSNDRLSVDSITHTAARCIWEDRTFKSTKENERGGRTNLKLIIQKKKREKKRMKTKKNKFYERKNSKIKYYNLLTLQGRHIHPTNVTFVRIMCISSI